LGVLCSGAKKRVLLKEYCGEEGRAVPYINSTAYGRINKGKNLLTISQNPDSVKILEWLSHEVLIDS
jgi:uncharacterized Fe-S cluster-containing radical SAM superfamily enzyme